MVQYAHCTECQPFAANSWGRSKYLKIMKNKQEMKGSKSDKNQYVDNITGSD